MADTKQVCISKAAFVHAVELIQEQEKINEKFGKALQLVGNGHYVFGSGNKYLEALLAVLKEAVGDEFSYIEWWLYEASSDYTVWSADEKEKWCLKDSGDLYDFITAQGAARGDQSDDRRK